MIVDPRGSILAEASSETEDLITQARKSFPWWRDRRPDLYGPLVGGPQA